MKQIYLLLSFFVLLSFGPAYGQTYILNEDFSSALGTTPPTGWSNTTITGVTTDKWRFDNLGNRNIPYPFTGKFAIFDSDNYSQGDGAENVVLESKFFDASISNNTLLTFDHFFVGGKKGKGTLEVYNGSSWSTVATFTDSTALPESKLFNLSSKVGGVTNAKIRFRWQGDASNYWAIDNIRIYSPLSRDAGMVKLNSPEMPFNSGSQTIKVTLANFGVNTLKNTTLKWKVNGVAQPSVNWTGSLGIGEMQENVTLANFTFQQGKQYHFKIWQENPNGQPDLNALNDTLYATLYSSLSGVYTIGGLSPDFKSFTEAVTVLNNAGVVGPVTFRVRNGTYNEQIVIGKVTGASAVNTVTFESESGDSTKVLLTYDVNSILNYVLLLKGAEHIKFNRLWITSVYRSNISPSLVLLEDKARHISFVGCKIGRPESNVYWYTGDYSIRVNTDSNDLLFSGNSIGGTYYGIYVASTVEGLTVSENTFANIRQQDVRVHAQSPLSRAVMVVGNRSVLPFARSEYNSISLYNIGNAVVKGNTLNRGIVANTAWGAVADEVAIEDNTITNSLTGGITTSGAGALRIVGNRITEVENAFGVWVASSGGALVANNFIHTKGQGSSTGIRVSALNVRVVFNSVYLTGSDPSNVRALEVTGGGSLVVKNNVFSNSGGGYAAVFEAAPGGTNDIDYNNYYSSGGRLGRYAGTDYTSLAAWGQAVRGDANSKAVNPFFKSTTDLSVNHIALNNAGIAINGITKDIDGATRDVIKPDMGAKDYTPASIDAGLDAFVSPTSPLTGTSIPVKVLLRNQGLSTLSSVSVQWTVNGVAQTPYNWSGSLASGASEEVTLKTYSFTGAPIFNIKAWTSSPNSQPDPNRYNDTTSIKNLVAALSGVYTIGGLSPDFKSFTEAVTVLNNAGVVGPVTFRVRNGTYNE
ncbi:MAG: right-handed parallel beta-helix repeat-containing protein, partial [Pontibacter sp.]|nr:right-handed parallel beta-helix repeat-containing protein [Pontibacter sp.]